jgi:hypothetical protein
VNDFFTWMTVPVTSHLGIIDKYIGDEIMVVFSKEFGSVDAFADSLRAARWMIENDGRAYCPHIGIASGIVTVGYVGTSSNYSCSVFGAPVTLAARCAADDTFRDAMATRIVFPASEWTYASLEDVFPRANGEPEDDEEDDGEAPGWSLHEARKANPKNIEALELRCIEWTLCRLPTTNASPEQSAKRVVQQLQSKGAYRPR